MASDENCRLGVDGYIYLEIVDNRRCRRFEVQAAYYCAAANNNNKLTYSTETVLHTAHCTQLRCTVRRIGLINSQLSSSPPGY